MNVPLVQRRGVLYLERRIRPTKFLGWAVMGKLQNEEVRISPYFKTRVEAEVFLVPGTEVRRRFKSKVKTVYDVAPVQWG